MVEYILMKYFKVNHPIDFSHLLVYLLSPHHPLRIHLILGSSPGTRVNSKEQNRQKFLSW